MSVLENALDLGEFISFNRSWDSWFESRFSGSPGQMDIETKEKENSYLVILKIPNLKDNKLDIKIDENGISVNGDLTQIIEQKDADGNIISRRESRQSIARKFPIPGDADHEKANIQH